MGSCSVLPSRIPWDQVLAPGGQLGQRGHECSDHLWGTAGQVGRGTGLGDFEQQGLQGFKEPVDLLHCAPLVTGHRQVLANGPHLRPEQRLSTHGASCPMAGGRACSYHTGEHAGSAADAAHAPHKLEKLSGQLHHQRRLQLTQYQELGAQHPARIEGTNPVKLCVLGSDLTPAYLMRESQEQSVEVRRLRTAPY